MEKAKCKSCSRERPTFALGPKDCDKCRVEKVRHEQSKVKRQTKVVDIVAKGTKLLLASDYRINKYSLEEPNSAKLEQWVDWRKQVRNKIRTCKDGDTMIFPKPPN